MLDVSDLRKTLVNLKLTGELNRNTPEANRQAIRELLARNSYWALEIERLADLQLSYEEVAEVVSSQLGISMARFASEEPPYIDPDYTVSRLVTGLHRLEAVARDGGNILLATAHPGSLLSFYQLIGDYLTGLGAHLVRPPEPVPAPEQRWLDDVNGVMVLSDEGNLMHTHASNGLHEFILKAEPDIVMSDHAFAIAAVNADIPTVAIFDVDDPAIPLMAHIKEADVVAIPMNDNQTNTRTAQAATCLIETLTHDAKSRNLHARPTGTART